MASLSSPPTLSTDQSNRYLEDVLSDETAPGSQDGVWIVITILALLALAFWLGAYSQQHTTRPAPMGPFEGEGTNASSTLVVHVAGQVNKPGVYNFPFDARVRDAVQKAGGPKPNADLNAINLAAWLEDGSKIEVPAKTLTAARSVAARLVAAPPLPTSESTPSAPTTSSSLPEYALPAPEENLPAPTKPSTPAPSATKESGHKTAKTKVPRVLPDVPRETTKSGDESQNASPEYLAQHQLNINTATAEQLELLPGIGPATAQKIVDYRKQNGGFKTVDELDNVAGIGEKTLEKLRPLVRVQ